jgi:chromosome segregation ATPase
MAEGATNAKTQSLLEEITLTGRSGGSEQPEKGLKMPDLPSPSPDLASPHIVSPNVVSPQVISQRVVTQLEFEWSTSPKSRNDTPLLNCLDQAPEPVLSDSVLSDSILSDALPSTRKTRPPELPPPLPSTVVVNAVNVVNEEGTVLHSVNLIDTATAPQPDQAQRILQLEQALDQCQFYINELKFQLVEQQFLEEVLAKTEEAAHVQQQAINSLKQQLQQQEQHQTERQALETENAAIQVALVNAESLNQSYRLELVHLQTHLQKERDAHQQTQQHLNQQLATIQLQLEDKKNEGVRLGTQLAQTEELIKQRTEQLTLLKTRAQQLETDLRTHQDKLSIAEANVQRTKEIVIAQQDVLDTLQQGDGSDSSKNAVIQKMSKSLLQSQNKIEVLESEITSQRLNQAKLQHYSQEWEEKSDISQKRISQLEQQVAEMQEQILQQAQQARELETAVQHWKVRSQTSDNNVNQLKTLVEHIVSDRNFADLEVALSGSATDQWQAAEDSAKLLSSLKVALSGLLASPPSG